MEQIDESFLVPLRVAVPLAQLRTVKAVAMAQGVPLAVLVRRLLTEGLLKEATP